jgi:hypothetical protein
MIPLPHTPHLPLWRTAWAGYRLAFGHIDVFAKVAWPWIVAAAAICYLALSLHDVLGMQVLVAAGMILWVIEGAMSVVWLRALVLGDVDPPDARLRVPIARYVLLNLVLVPVVVPLAALDWTWFANGGEVESGAAAYASAGALVWVLVGTLVVIRLSLAFVGAAVDDRRTTFASSWGLLRHAYPRLFLVALLTGVPIAFLTPTLGPMPAIPDRADALAVMLAGDVVYLAVEGVILAIAYRSLVVMDLRVEAPPAPAPAVPRPAAPIRTAPVVPGTPWTREYRDLLTAASAPPPQTE